VYSYDLIANIFEDDEFNDFCTMIMRRSIIFFAVGNSTWRFCMDVKLFIVVFSIGRQRVVPYERMVDLWREGAHGDLHEFSAHGIRPDLFVHTRTRLYSFRQNARFSLSIFELN